MKCFSTLDVKTDGSLSVKRSNVVFTGQRKNFGSNEEAEEEEVVPSNHITIHECDNLYSEIELAETPETFEDGGQTTVDDLKELNLRTNEEPCPIYISSSLTLKEEKQYLELLSEYKDVLPGAIKKCLSWTQRLQFIAYLSKGVFCQRSNLCDVFAQSWYQKLKRRSTNL